ncbi:hypothetical protein N7499_011416 [Penicillium canescens]|uniref:Zn(2)-C6 fungal-type domain-containing protein n=1 Tax=Penicillium canescens TaxID=5083 RepID=A0AAD6NCW1_PENCN|nr:uncharacterized protein N7446_006670 [Penicillium canescens]KAJ5990868.1 hypothetical protein N7522_011075 [Penicillium canescens]KAJ6050002.1 hypothetical protein N7444_006718 [Penicillium canescens]KAJ6052031.1 hypothetical protein N7460_002565 [Penicillium canescens]KAJ6062550.1 hypothetical protein N7446_006670 [Penicillium canescens]KAJ6069529.1 hypothetical protein N7499_011416 [Penicillium canescens]
MEMPPEKEPDLAADFTASDTSLGKKKRSNSEAAEYPRRRATIACQICRLRKTRCNGARPKCQLCSDLNAECVYREPGIKLDAGDKLILDHLARIEGLLHSSLAGQGSHMVLSSTSPATSNDTNLGSDETLARASGGLPVPGRLSAVGLGSWVNPPASISISTMPKMHTTPALHLLQWPLIRDLVSVAYDPQHLLQLEMAREPLRMTPNSGFDLTNASTYAQAFFNHGNVWYACVNPFTWNRYYQTALAQGFQEGPMSCLVLLVLALGSASHSGSISFVPPDREPPGLPYFAAAWSVLPSVMMRNTVFSTQCMVLASAYLFYLVRPLEAWTLLSNVSMKLQLLFGNPNRIPNQWRELSVRVYWNALLFESDLLAELDLPHSGIVHFEERVDLPGGFEDEDAEDEDDEEDGDIDQGKESRTTRFREEAAGREELWYFLAEIALRRLLNRVSHIIYQKDCTHTLSSLGPIVSELDFQLSQWYESLPGPVQFPLTQAPLSNPVQTVLRLRYNACRTIIYRPYILAVFENEQAGTDSGVRECCRRCLDATLRQLEHITSHREGHLPYLWQGALSIVSQTLLIMGATMSPSLSTLLPPGPRMDSIIASVVGEVERYAHLAPSLKLSAEIIRDAERRRQICLRSAGLCL